MAAGAAAAADAAPPTPTPSPGRVSRSGRTRHSGTTIPQLRAFVENGGTIVAIGDSAANLAAQLKLPVENHLVENGAPLPRAKLLRAGLGAARKVDARIR